MISAAAWPAAKARLEEWAQSWPAQTAIQGSGTKLRHSGPTASTLGLTGLIEHDAADQVAVAWAGTPLSDLQAELRAKGQCLPLPQTGHFWLDGGPGTLGGLAAMSLPHALEAQHGEVRDWVLGMAICRADGTIARCGSKAVKSVAGYDAHRFLCGSQGRLAAIGIITFRTWPVRALRSPAAEALAEGAAAWIQRVRPADYAAARAGAETLLAADPESCTLWHAQEPARVEHDWVLAPSGALSPSPAPSALLQRVKDLLDPTGRFPSLLPHA